MKSLGRLFMALTIVCLTALDCPSWASDTATFQWTVILDGQPTSRASVQEPLKLRPKDDVPVAVDLKNTGTSTVDVRALRLEGSVIGMTFFGASARLDIHLAPGQTAQRRLTMDLSELGNQAVGLIPTRLELLNESRTVIVSDSFPVDVIGSPFSVYGIFGFGIAACTAVLLAELLLAVARARLPQNRWRRGVRMVAVGIGIGMTATFTLSAARLMTPSASAWLTIVLAGGAIAFAVGYFMFLPNQPRSTWESDDGEFDPDDVEYVAPPDGIFLTPRGESPEKDS